MTIAEKLTTITENQQKVYDAGYEKGKTEGGAGGDGSYDEGYTAGQQAEYDRWWNLFQMNGTKTSYPYAFYNWREGMMTPKYPIRMTESNSAQAAFSALRCTEIPVDVEIGNANPKVWTNNAGNTFSGADKLVTIKKLIISYEGVQFPNTFYNCKALQNITIEGVIANSISFQQSPLTNASVQSIIDHLKDLTGQTTQTLTLKADVGAAVTDAQNAAITAKNWTLVY